jgi:hypothetical protein
MKLFKFVSVVVFMFAFVLVANAQFTTYALKKEADVYPIGKEMAEIISLSLIAGMEEELGKKVKNQLALKEDKLTLQGQTWPVINATMTIDSKDVPFKTITFTVAMEAGQAEKDKYYVAGTIMAIKVDGKEDNPLDKLLGTMYTETPNGFVEVRVQTDGKMVIVE